MAINKISLKNKRILITAGPTWVPIDDIRVISNIATGRTGIALAEKLSRLGAKVVLFLGPVGACCIGKKIKVVDFKFFDELRRGLRKELKKNKYDIIIHSAAVSDFKPVKKAKGKIASSKRQFLELVPLPKIVKDIRRLDIKAKLVMFKLEQGVSESCLVKRAVDAQKKNGADLMVANRLVPYSAFIIDREGGAVRAKSKVVLIEKLLKALL